MLAHLENVVPVRTTVPDANMRFLSAILGHQPIFVSYRCLKIRTNKNRIMRKVLVFVLEGDKEELLLPSWANCSSALTGGCNISVRNSLTESVSVSQSTVRVVWVRVRVRARVRFRHGSGSVKKNTPDCAVTTTKEVRDLASKRPGDF
jgi:hypothetical protein